MNLAALSAVDVLTGALALYPPPVVAVLAVLALPLAGFALVGVRVAR